MGTAPIVIQTYPAIPVIMAMMIGQIKPPQMPNRSKYPKNMSINPMLINPF